MGLHKDGDAMLVLNAADVWRALPMPDAISAMREAFTALYEQRATVPNRIHLPVPRHAGVSLVMPSLVDADDLQEQALVVKVASVFDRNQAFGLARIQSAVIVLAPHTGRPIALLEGAALTAIRTAAASGLATDLLARPDSSTLAVFGSGIQARSHIIAMSAVRPIRTIRIFSRSASKAQAMIDELKTIEGTADEIVLAESPREATEGADIICATTSSKDSVFDAADIAAGTHINAIGSYTPTAREIPAETIARARVYVDSREAAWSEAGDLIQPFQSGLINRHHVVAELGELIFNSQMGRQNDLDVTVFKSVGIAVQDAVAARFAINNSKRMRLGTEVNW
jgi:alanine dehydrogenase